MNKYDRLATVILALLGAAVLASMALGLAATGPGCKDDPEWLGYCAAIDRR